MKPVVFAFVMSAFLVGGNLYAKENKTACLQIQPQLKYHPGLTAAKNSNYLFITYIQPEFGKGSMASFRRVKDGVTSRRGNHFIDDGRLDENGFNYGREADRFDLIFAVSEDSKTLTILTTGDTYSLVLADPEICVVND